MKVNKSKCHALIFTSGADNDVCVDKTRRCIQTVGDVGTICGNYLNYKLYN